MNWIILISVVPCLAKKYPIEYEYNFAVIVFLGVTQRIPEDEVLKELSQNIGNCAIHLGIELGLDILAVESTLFAYPRDMFEQNYDILKKWKQHSRTKTLYILMRALQRVMPQGMNFLERKYNIKIG